MKEKRIYVGKRSSSPIRISFNARITLEAKEQLEKIAKQWHMSQTAVLERVVSYIADASNIQNEKIKLEYEKKRIEQEYLETTKKIEQLNLKG
jgi:DNA polymerase III delta prime subunit